MLGQRLRRWPNVKTSPGGCGVGERAPVSKMSLSPTADNLQWIDDPAVSPNYGLKQFAGATSGTNW